MANRLRRVISGAVQRTEKESEPMSQDPVVSFLLKSPLTPNQRRAASEAFTGSANEDDLQSRMEALKLPRHVMADLWDLKAAAPKQPTRGGGANDGSVFATPSMENVGRFAKNAWEMVNPLNIVKGLYHASTEPMETGAAILGQSGDQLVKSREALEQGRFTEAKGHFLGAIPVVGPIAVEAGEQIASGDVAGGLGKTVGILAPFGAAEAGARLGVRALPKQAATALERGAAKRYADVMRPKAGNQAGRRLGNKADTIAPEVMADNPKAPWSRTGLHDQVTSKLDDALAVLDDAQNSRLSARTFKTDPILTELRQQRQRWVAESVDASRIVPAIEEVGPGHAVKAGLGEPRFSKPSLATSSFDPQPVKSSTVKVARPFGSDVTPGPNAARVKMIDQAIKEIEALGPEAKYESLRRIREAYDKPARTKYNPSMTDDFLAKTDEASGAADVTGTLRDHLAKFDPETASANANYSLYRNADDILTAAQEIDKAKPRVGRQIMTRLTTTLMGGEAGGAVGAVAGFTLAPVVDALMSAGVTPKLKIAQTMNDLSKAIRKGDVGRVNSLSFKVRQLMKQAEATRAKGSVALEPSRQEQ